MVEGVNHAPSLVFFISTFADRNSKERIAGGAKRPGKMGETGVFRCQDLGRLTFPLNWGLPV